ncbi:MAG: flagellar export chaperone FlgN [Calditrichia bacterium]|nr:flagellar export chaperone FlgN [Calditrichia bacterium]
MEQIKSLYNNFNENVRLLNNFKKAIEKQQKALVNNNLTEIQETALMQADIMGEIVHNQDKLSAIIEAINSEFNVNLPDDKFSILENKISNGLYKKIDKLIDLQQKYQFEINEYKQNNQILFENAMDFVQSQMKIIVDVVKETPFYKNGNKEKKQPAVRLLNKKM